MEDCESRSFQITVTEFGAIINRHMWYCGLILGVFPSYNGTRSSFLLLPGKGVGYKPERSGTRHQQQVQLPRLRKITLDEYTVDWCDVAKQYSHEDFTYSTNQTLYLSRNQCYCGYCATILSMRKIFSYLQYKYL